MLNDTEIEQLKRLSYEREWVKNALPIENSLAAFDLLLTMANSLLTSDRKPTVKEFFASIDDYSYTAIRTHYIRFIELGLIELEPNLHDARVKHLRPTIRLAKLISSYLELRENLFRKKKVAPNWTNTINFKNGLNKFT